MTPAELQKQAVLEAIKKAKEEGGPFIIDCCECEEWDGESYRCECGNRRMYWTTYGRYDSPNGVSAYPAAN